VFDFFKADFTKDPTIRRDAQKLAKRLAEREGGQCRIGFVPRDAYRRVTA
jgi:hypothetical protein